jgi:hypothetical protein
MDAARCARLLTSAGLIVNILGVICLGYLVPHGSVPLWGAPAAPNTPVAKLANPLGWLLTGIGFALQLAAQVI